MNCPECGSVMLPPIEPGQDFYWCLKCGHESKLEVEKVGGGKE